MLIKAPFKRLVPVLTALALIAPGPGRANDEFPAKGPAAINVSRYPPGIQENYRIFSQKCSQCHDLSRPLNASYVLPDEWSSCLKRMRRHSQADISPAEEKKLYDFLIYDSSIRKKDKLEEKLQTLAPNAQQQAKNKIKAVTEKYE